MVKHQKLYSAFYCGLCHSLRKIGAYGTLPFFSYDFVFFAVLRSYVLEEEMQLEKNFCLFHPFRRKKMRIASNPTMEYCAFASSVILYHKLQDDRMDGDVSAFRRFSSRILLFVLKREIRKGERKFAFSSQLVEATSQILSQGKALEDQSADLDAVSSNFASYLSLLLAYGAEGQKKRILEGIADFLGRFIYTVDALADREKDRESGAFNPLVKEGALPDETKLCQLDMLLSFYVGEMKKILDLASGDSALSAICENVICLGLPLAAKNAILLQSNHKTKEKKRS